MASEGSDGEDQTEASHGPRECMPCRGSGKVISNLGGSPSTVTCPWCEGGGIRLADIDAQARWLDDQAGASGQGDSSDQAADA
jgi:DnaJ-class molecular chaperone